jgi:hypothetical protein
VHAGKPTKATRFTLAKTPPVGVGVAESGPWMAHGPIFGQDSRHEGGATPTPTGGGSFRSHYPRKWEKNHKKRRPEAAFH